MFSLERPGNNLTKRRKNEVKIKNLSTYFKPINFKSLKSL